MKRIFFAIFFLPCFIIYGQAIFSNDIFGSNPHLDNPYITGQVVDANMTANGIGRGLDINPPASGTTNHRYNARTWNTTQFDVNDYFYFTFQPNAGYEIDLLSFEFNLQRSNGGPTNIVVRSSLDNYSSDIGNPVAPGGGGTALSTIDLSDIAYQNINSTITFRIYAWGSVDSNGTLSVNDFIFNGTVTPIPCPSPAAVWNGSAWSPSAPTSSAVAILNGNYNTSINGSFSCCRLTVNSGTLIIGQGDYVEVQNELVNNSNITVSSEGSFIQISDLATVSGSGTTIVEQRTAPANDWYEYTYWSSPVINATISNGLSDAQSGRIFSFSAQNYLDSTMETNNNNATMPGQDGIDDDANDWQSVSGATIMTPGMGYASTHNEVIFDNSPNPVPRQFTYTFEGDLNNGVITVPLYRNDSETNDNNWNFIGNPYASAIDADAFLNANSDVDGAIYFWSQNTPPSSTANGNEILNFSDGDYAIINGSGTAAGGDAVIPNRFIPSCQGFFVSYSDLATPIFTSGNISEGSVTFNNAMRVRGATDNSQFFKSANNKEKGSEENDYNKLRINLTSNNGVFNQILIAYIDGATKFDDGARFDARRRATSSTKAILYSKVKKSDEKFAIQGLSKKDLSNNEKIQLGFLTNINVPTTFNLSIADFQGAFMNNNPIYLKDNLLKKTHNLSDSGYTFTSEVGEFNDRFEIVFKSNPSVHDLAGKSSSEIRTLGNDSFEFSISKEQTIKSIVIFDLLGNTIYNLKGRSSDEIYYLPKLGKSIYVAKIELTNGGVITKKFVKG